MTFAPAIMAQLRIGTKAFIAMSPVSIVLEVYSEVDDGVGGKKRLHTASRLPQTFTLIEPRDSGNRDKATIQEGTNTTYDFMLLGEHDATVGQYDQFVHDGIRYRVENLMINNGYEVRARVLRDGPR